ncbi:hypothetical protein LJPFL01_1805 [Lelliottia jeotgali]|nr:hypothetical protein LJPFL01_1805 [Lelliottia jeotgali]
MPECWPNEGELQLYVVFCIPSAETIHPGIRRALYADFQIKGKWKRCFKNILCSFTKIVIKALRRNGILLRQTHGLPQIA